MIYPPKKKEKRGNKISNSQVLVKPVGFSGKNNFYRSLVDSLTGYAVFTTDKKGNISSWSVGAQKLFGYTEKEIMGKNAVIIFRQDDIDKHKLQKELHKAVMVGKVTIERYHVHKDGSPFWASGLIFALDNKEDVSQGFTFIIRDLTDKMEFEKRKDAFISTATHELRTPITSMRLNAHIVEQEIKKIGSTTSKQSIASLNKQLDKIILLMDYLLDIDKIQTGELNLQKKFFDVDELIAETIVMAQTISKKHTLIQEGKIRGRIYGDKERIKQVLINLITNAIKYSPGANKVIVIGSNDQNKIIVSVKDFGFGVSMLEQPEIFKRFYRANAAIDNKIEGVGLGLYVAQQIVVAHKGKMWMESENGKGSTFYFSIPRKK